MKSFINAAVFLVIPILLSCSKSASYQKSITLASSEEFREALRGIIKEQKKFTGLEKLPEFGPRILEIDGLPEIVQQLEPMALEFEYPCVKLIVGYQHGFIACSEGREPKEAFQDFIKSFGWSKITGLWFYTHPPK